MDFAKVGQGSRIAGIAGGLLFIDLFLSWYSFNTTGEQEAQLARAGVDTSYSAWSAFGFIDILLAVTCVVAVALLVRAAGGLKVELPVPLSTIAAGLGAVSSLLVIYRLINEPGIALGPFHSPDSATNIEWGAYLGLVLVLLLTWGAFKAMGEAEPAPAPSATTTAPPPPPPAAPTV